MRRLLAVLLLVLFGGVDPVVSQTQGIEPAAPQEPLEEEDLSDDVEDPASETSEAEEAEEEPPAGPIVFDIPFPAERGGGSVAGSAGSLEYEEEGLVVLSGGVDLRYKDIKLTAKLIELDQATKVVTAVGDVILDEGTRRLSGSRAVYDLEGRTGTVNDASAYVDPDYYFTGSEIAKTGADTYLVEDGVFTSCTDEVPDWSFRLKKAEITLGGYAKIRNASMRVKKVPVLYSPYILWPAKTERASGLLIPQPGYSRTRGASLSLAYYQTLGRSYDTTIYADLYTKDYFGVGNEFRYKPSENTEGRFEGFAIKDPLQDDDWRWRVNYNHESRALPFGMRGVISYTDFSDFDYYRDFERDFSRSSLRSLYSRGFMTGNWGSHSLNILADNRETVISGDNTVTLRRLPEVEYRLRPTRLGKAPVYFELDSSLAYLDLQRSETYEGSYGRLDLTPSFTVPIKAWPWLSLSVNAGQRFTWYGDSLCGGTGDGACPTTGQEFRGESLTRSQTLAGVSVVGPSFSRIFDRPVGSFAKFKHVIEPRFTYGYASDLDDEELTQVPVFDEIDSLFSNNLGRWALINRVLGKPQDEKEGAREIFSFELSQRYSFDEDRPLQRSSSGDDEERFGPLEAEFRFNPSKGTSVKAEFRYSTLFDELISRSLSGSYRFGRNTLGLTWFTRLNGESGETTSDQARIWTTLNLIPKKLSLQAQINYDIEQSFLQQQRYLLQYNSQCYSYVIEAREYRIGDRTDQDYRLAISLKNIGSFLDLSGRRSAGN